MEFVAGLVDEGEGAEEAARRELEEEVGYRHDVVVVGVHGPMALEAGFSDSKATMVFMSINGDSEHNQERNLHAKPEDGEHITTFLIPFPEVVDHLLAFEASGSIICVAVWCFALGAHGRGTGGLKPGPSPVTPGELSVERACPIVIRGSRSTVSRTSQPQSRLLVLAILSTACAGFVLGCAVTGRLCRR